VSEDVDVSALLQLGSLQKPGAPDIVGRILNRFFAESAERLQAIQSAVAAGDAQALERVAHALKGIAGTVGAHGVDRLAVRLEQLGREGRTQDAAPLVTELESALERTRTTFEQSLGTRPDAVQNQDGH